MPDIDERVVSMKFDNKQFEKGVQTSIGTLDKLKQSLKFSGVADTVSKTTNKISSLFSDMINKINSAPSDSIQDSLDYIANQVSNKGRVISNEIQKIVDFAENQFKRLYSFIIKDPFSDGFKEYELKMGSVQTIMNSTGESLETVMGYLEELNVYADRTIYSFSDMTSSIGKFTNSGVSLDDAVAAIQGVSNMAAVSGANAQQASHAMYNFAQALSSGSVKLIDWKSIENANMATVEFKQTLLDSALALGTVVETEEGYVTTTTNLQGSVSTAFDAVHDFNGSLAHQWLTTDVLVDALRKYTDETTEFGQKAFAAAQDVKTWTQLLDTLKEAIGSGWGQSFEIIIGNFDEAKELFTKINNVLSPIIDKTADFRNAYLQAWVDNGGRDRAIEKIEEFLNSLSNAVDKVMDFGDTALKVFFGEDYVKLFGDVANGVSDLINVTDKLISKEDLERWQIAYDIWTKASWGNGEERKRLITEHFGDDGESYEAIQDIIEDIIAGNVDYEQGLKDITEQYNEQEKAANKVVAEEEKILTTHDKLTKAFSDIRFSISNVIQITQNLSNAFKNVVSLFLDTVGKSFNFQTIASDIRSVTNRFYYFSSVISDITENSSSFRVIFTKIVDTANSVYDSISEFVSSIMYNIGMIFNTITSNEEFVSKLLNTIDKGLKIIKNVSRIISNIAQSVLNLVSIITDSFLRSFDFDKIVEDISFFVDIFASFTEGLKNGTKETSKISKFFDIFFRILSAVYSIVSSIVKVIVKIGLAVINTITNIISVLKEFVQNSGEDSLLVRGWTAIKKIFENVITLFSKIKDAFTEDVDGTGSLLDKITEFIGTVGGGVLELIVSLLESIADLDFDNLDFSWLDKLKSFDILNLFGNEEKNPFSNFGKWLKGALSKENLKMVLDWALASCNAVLSAIGSLDWSTIWSITSFFIFVLIGMKIVKTLKSISGLMESITKITDNISSTIKDIGSAIKTKILGSVFNTTIALILAMFGMLIVFTELPQDKLINASTIMITILIILKDVISKVLDTVSTTHTSNSRLQKLTGFMGAFAAIIGSIAALMIALSVMSYIFDKTEHPIKMMVMSVLMIAAVGGVIVGLLFAIKKLGTSNTEKTFKGLAKGLLGLTEVVGVMAIIAWIIEKANIGWMSILKTIVLLIAISGVMVGLMAAVKHWNRGAKKLKAFAAGMLMISFAIDALIPVLTVIALIDKLAGVSPIELIGSISMIILAMAGLVYALGKATSGTSNSIGKKLLILAVGLALVISSISYLISSGGFMAILDLIGSPEGFDKFKFILEEITIALLVFVGVIALLAFAISKAPNIGMALMEIGIGFGLVGVGVLAAATGILILTWAMQMLPEAAEGIVAFVAILQENGQSIVKFVTILVIMIIAGILAGVAVMKGSMAVQVISIILYVLVLAASFLHGHVHEAVDFLAAVIGDILLLLRGVTKVVAQGLLSLCILVIGELAIALIKKTPTILEILGKAISGIIRQVFSYLMGELFKGIGDLASALGELLMSSDITLFQTIGASANIWGVEAYETGRTISKNLSEDAEANAAEIQEILDRESNAMETASGNMTEKIDKIKDIIMGKGEALTGSFGWAEGFDGGKVSGDINQMFNDPIGALTKGGNSFKFAADDASLNVLSGYGNLNNALNQQLMSYDEFKKQFEVFGKTYIDEGIIKKLYSEYSDESATGMSSLFDSLQNEKLMSGMKTAGINTGGDFVSGITEGIGTNIELPEGLDIYGIEGLDTEGVDFSQYGIDISEDISDGAMYNEEAFEEAGNVTANVLMDNFENVSVERANQVGNMIAEHTSNGIKDNFERNKASVVSKADEYGRAVGSGIVSGYTARMESIRRVANISGNSILTAFCDTLGIASPSKEMRKLATYTLQGLIFGLRDEQSSLEQETSNAGNSMIEALKSPMDFLISYFNGELEYDPSIRPVMDISGVRTGMTGINGMINGSTYQLGAEVSASMSQAALDKLDYATDVRNGFNDGNVVNAIGKLNKDINTLNDSMSNMSVVMDTGALVGQLSEGMDYALGQRQYMRGRGM